MNDVRWKLFVLVVVTLGVVLPFARYLVGWRTVKIDCDTPIVLTLEPRAGDGWPMGVTKIAIRIQGEIDGEMEVWAGNWEPERLKGMVSWSTTRDWYEPVCQLQLRPRGVVSGKLLVSYQFCGDL